MLGGTHKPNLFTVGLLKPVSKTTERWQQTHVGHTTFNHFFSFI